MRHALCIDGSPPMNPEYQDDREIENMKRHAATTELEKMTREGRFWWYLDAKGYIERLGEILDDEYWEEMEDAMMEELDD